MSELVSALEDMRVRGARVDLAFVGGSALGGYIASPVAAGSTIVELIGSDGSRRYVVSLANVAWVGETAAGAAEPQRVPAADTADDTDFIRRFNPF